MNLAGKNIKCIAFDLDHTVINSDGTMSDATRTVIEQAIAEGIEIVPVSGRAFATFPESIGQIKGIVIIVKGGRAGLILGGLRAFLSVQFFFAVAATPATATATILAAGAIPGGSLAGGRCRTAFSGLFCTLFRRSGRCFSGLSGALPTLRGGGVLARRYVCGLV